MDIKEIVQRPVELTINGKIFRFLYTYKGAGFIAEKYGSFWAGLEKLNFKNDADYFFSSEYMQLFAEMIKAGIMWDKTQDMEIEDIKSMIPYSTEAFKSIYNTISTAAVNNMPQVEDPDPITAQE